MRGSNLVYSWAGISSTAVWCAGKCKRILGTLELLSQQNVTMKHQAEDSREVWLPCWVLSFDRHSLSECCPEWCAVDVVDQVSQLVLEVQAWDGKPLPLPSLGW